MRKIFQFSGYVFMMISGVTWQWVNHTEGWHTLAVAAAFFLGAIAHSEESE